MTHRLRTVWAFGLWQLRLGLPTSFLSIKKARLHKYKSPHFKSTIVLKIPISHSRFAHFSSLHLSFTFINAQKLSIGNPSGMLSLLTPFLLPRQQTCPPVICNRNRKKNKHIQSIWQATKFLITRVRAKPYWRCHNGVDPESVYIPQTNH